MKVSVLVPIYGVEKYIERCSRSLFEQSYFDLEFVFVNDCTPDKSIEILEHIVEDYPARKPAVKIISHETNRGVSATRNTLLENAEGDFVTWVDSDDWLELNAIELLVKKQVETGADVVSGYAIMHYANGDETLKQPYTLDKQEIVIGKLGNGWQDVIWGRIIRRSIIETNHIEAIEGCDMAEDKYLMVQISYYSNSFAVCEEVVYNYERRNDNSIVSQKSSDKVLRNGLQLLQNNRELQKFFSDKESVYYKEASKQTMLYAFEVLKMMVRFNKKQHFRWVVETIDATESMYWPLICWSTKGVKGFLLHRYCFVWLWLTMKRSLRFIRRKFHIT